MTKTIRSRLAGYFLAVIILMFAVNINTGAENDTNNKNGTSEATEEVIVHNEVKVSVNGYGVKFTERPVFQNGVLFLELEAIVKVLGYTCEDNNILYRDNVYEVKDSVISNDKVFISADELLEIQKPVLWAEIKIDVINPQIKLTVNKYCEPKWENQSPVFKNGELYIPLEPILTSLGLTMDYSADTLNIYRQGDLVYSMSTNSYVPDDENNTAYMNVNQLDSIKTNILWAEIDIDVDNSGVLPKSLILDIPIIPMLPDYPTGCEFRSVEMMLAGIGISIDIENLINDTPVNNDPRLGIRGDPRFPLDDPQRRYAYWIYPPAMIEPIESAAPVTAVDLTGISLSELKSQIAKYKVGVCVHMGRWNDDFVYHDVLVVGYDSNYIYINDSYSATQMKFTYQKFTELWEVTEADRDSIPYYTKDRALSLITTDEQMKKAKYEIVY